MKPECKWTRQERNQRERRARKQQDHALTATIAALGAGDESDWPQDATEQNKPARHGARDA